MRKFKRLTLTLALLLTAVGGAWAQSSLNVVELDVPAEWAKDNSNATAGDLPGFKASTYAEAKTWTGAPAGMAVLIYAFDGNKICYVLFSNGKAGGESKITFTKKAFFDQKSSGKFYYTAELTEWSLTPDETGKTWTLAKMPASNIELQVEYFAESNLFLSKDALADMTNIAVTAGELGVQFDKDGKSANTVTEGSAMTVKYNGAKKVIGVKVEKKVAEPVADIIWDGTNVTDLNVESTYKSYTKEGVKLSGNADQVQVKWNNSEYLGKSGMEFITMESGGFTFTAPTGKKFTKIEMKALGSSGWAQVNLGTGWAYNTGTVTWNGSAASTVKLLKDADMFSGDFISSIAFYLSE